MTVFPPEITETLQVSANLLIILSFPGLLYAYYRFLPRVGARLGTQLAKQFLGGLFQILQSTKMKSLSEKGVDARNFQELLKQPTGEDPVKEILSPIVASFVSERWGKKAAGAVEMGLQMVPVNVTDLVLPSLAKFLDAKFPQLKLQDQLHALKAIQRTPE